jgi:hypothetical protein
LRTLNFGNQVLFCFPGCVFVLFHYRSQFRALSTGSPPVQEVVHDIHLLVEVAGLVLLRTECVLYFAQPLEKHLLLCVLLCGLIPVVLDLGLAEAGICLQLLKGVSLRLDGLLLIYLVPLSNMVVTDCERSTLRRGCRVC